MTGRYNYEKFAKSIRDDNVVKKGVDYVAKNYAWSCSGFWWKSNGMNKLCNRGATVEEVTYKVNGGYNGLAERKEYYKKCKKYIK